MAALDVGTSTYRIATAFAAILDETVPNSPGTEETPSRAAKAWQEMTSGYGTDIEALFTTFDAEGYDQMIAVPGIPFTSLCEHHLLPFEGTVDVVYIPGKEIVGLSKVARVVLAYARRLQIQERLTQEVADAMDTYLNPRGVMVVCEASHTCMRCRGVRSEGRMVTSALRGVLCDDGDGRGEARGLIGR